MAWQDDPIVATAPRQWESDPILEVPQDTGQGYASSLVYSVGRGFARVAADIPGGLGYLTGSDSLVQLGDDIEAGINDALPVNPIFQDDFAMKAAGAVGQAGSMIATGGIGGAVGKSLGGVRIAVTVADRARNALAIKRGMEIGALGAGFFAGARGGGQDAEHYGMDGAAAYSRILAGGAIEVATEKLLFGMGTETRAMRRMLGEAVEDGTGRFTKDVLTEGGEEFVAEVGNNASNSLLAPTGTETPGLFHGSGEAFALGMVGGGTFGGFNALMGRAREQEDFVTVESGSIPLPATPVTSPPIPPGPPVSTEIAGQPFYFDGTQWTVPVDPSTVSASPELEAPFRPLNPGHPIEGTLIVELENRRKAAMRTATQDATSNASNQAPSRDESLVNKGFEAGPKVDIQEDNAERDMQPAIDRNRALLEQAAATLRGDGAQLPKSTQAVFGGQGSASRSASASLPDPTGSDIITALQGEKMRLGQVNDSGEWDWYRELEKAAETSKLKKQEVAARVRRGELEDAAALFEWVNQNVVDREQGGKIDEAASLLNDMDGFQSFGVDSNSIGPAILEAIAQRQKAREQGGLDEHMEKLEADQIESERQQTRDFLSHAFASDAPAVTGNRLSQQVQTGSKLRVNGVEFTVAAVNENEGTLAVQDDTGRFGYQQILADDSLPVESVDGNAIERHDEEEVPEDRIAFSRVDRSLSEKQNPADEHAFAHLNFQPRPDADLAQNEREALDHIRRNQGDATIFAAAPSVNNGSAQSVERGNTAQVSLHALEQVFGKKILFVASSQGRLSFDGASSPDARNVLILDYQSGAPLMYLTGHELIHSLKAQRPELWNEMRDGLLALASDWTDYRSRLQNRYEDSEMVDEFLGDFVGGEFRNPEFWKQAAERNPSTFGRLARAALDFLNKILKKLSSYGRDVEHYFQDLDAARSVVIDALGKYAEAGVFPERVLEDANDADLVSATQVDKTRRGPNLLRANLSPQQPGSNAAVDALRRSLFPAGPLQRPYAGGSAYEDPQGDSQQLARLPAGVAIRAALSDAQRDIRGLGAEVEEISSEEATRRGYMPNFYIGVTPDGRKLVVIGDRLAQGFLTEETARAVVREEVIHLAWLAAMRAEHARSGLVPFDQWLEQEMNGWLNELSTSEAGSQMLMDAGSIYLQRPFQNADEVLQAYEGHEIMLISELARQLIQLRESGEITESVIAKAIHKLRQWFTAALQRLKAVAANVKSVSPTLEAAIAETERILNGLSAPPPGATPSSLPPIPANLSAMNLTSMRMSDADEAMREMLKPHKASRDERTVDGSPIEQAGYLVRRDADMEAAADNWLDAFADGQARDGRSLDDMRVALDNALEAADVDVAAVLLTRLIDGRGREFGMDSAQVQSMGQKNASRAGFALREWKKTLDPLDRLVDQATATTGTEMGRQFRGEVPTGTAATDVPTVMNQQLQEELKAEANKAALDAIESLRSANSDLRRSLKEAKERAEEERERADQEREVGISIGREEGLEQGRSEQPPAPPRELDVFENWLMGEKVEGLPSLEQVARRFIQPQRWDGERFRSALGQLFPTLDQNILDDAVDRITEQMNNRLAAARRRAVTAFLDRLAERNKRLQNDQRFVTFYGHLQKAAEFGILDSQLFANAFAAAWGLNGLTPAMVMQLRQMYQQITATNSNGQPVYYGMVRETMERRFIEAVNRIAPGQAWLNFIFNNYQARVLSSASSMLNQFSAVFRILTPVDAIARSYRMGQVTDPAVVLSEYWAGISSLGRNLPLMMTAIRGESLGHLPSALARGHVPSEQQTQHLQPGEAIRVGRTQLGRRASWLARMSELWTWRTIRAAEGLTGIADAEAHFRETLTNHYRDQGMTPAAARRQALQDIHASPQVIAAATQQATQEQRAGTIGTGPAVIERRIQEIIQREIDTRLSVAATDRTEQLTGYTQFKTMPAGPIGFAVARFMAGVASPAGSASRYARFWFLFGRFLGHSVDVSLGYTPGAHLLTRRIFNTQNVRRQNLINEVFGNEAAYNRMVDSRAVTGASFMVMTGGLMGLAALMAGDDDEPWFAVTGTGGLGDQARKDALKATGKWGEMQVRIGGRPVLGYSQIPELAPLLGILGNISDHMRFGDFLNQRMAREGEQPGKHPADVSTLGLGFAADWALSPIKRSTYRAWFDTIDGLLGIQSAGGADYAGRQIAGLATRPIDGMLRVPVVVDVDKAIRFAEGSLKPEGVLENVLRRVPFVHVGQEVFNAYGERSPAWDIFTMIPMKPAFSEEATRAARLNVETGTRRGAPQDISLHYADGSVRELKPEELTAYQELSGRIYTESLLRNEADIRRAFEKGGQGAASKIVENISAKANKEAKKELGF